MYISEADSEVRIAVSICKLETGGLVIMLCYGVLEKKNSQES